MSKVINKTIKIKVKRENVYKLYLAKLFSASNIQATDLELNILNSLRNNVYLWDTNKICKSMGISLPHLNNYKKKLKDKKLILKVGERYVMNPDLELHVSSTVNEYNIIFSIITEDVSKESKEIPADSGESSANRLEGVH